MIAGMSTAKPRRLRTSEEKKAPVQGQASSSVRLLCGPPRSFDEFERRVRLVTDPGSDAILGAKGWMGRRAATLARRAGACDNLITAALVHDFARYFDGREEACVARRSASLLVAVFPSPVLEPMRCLGGGSSSGMNAGEAPAYVVAHGRRLRAYIDSARAGGEEALLPWQLLLGIARRTSFDG
jgi:hypothetical protein